MRYILPIIIILLAASGVWYVKENAPQSKKRPPTKAASITVSTHTIKASEVKLSLQSFGQISAKTTSTLTSQVSGLVTSVSDDFVEGRFFKKGDLLLSLDNRDFQSAINSAKASLTQAQQDLALEKAQVTQAKADWRRLNKNKAIPALVSRTPQVLKAKAQVSAAHAQYNQAVLNFRRSKITAPFTGRILAKKVSVGDFINANSTLAELMTTDALQVRLSLKNSDLAFINLPEINNQKTTSLPTVSFKANLISPQHWTGKIVRTEAAIDSASQQLFVIGEIEQPFAASNADKHPLKIGQFVTAKIQGKALQNAISIGINSIYQGEFVFLLKDNVIVRQDIDILWQDDETALIGKGLADKDKLIVSILSLDAQGSPGIDIKDAAKKTYNDAGRVKKSQKAKPQPQ
ncbi:MAG: multidrug efflux system membrane fusion protein [Oceanospirillaceae bacterium]|jgi:multidrug efflux system membrane fusion protein